MLRPTVVCAPARWRRFAFAAFCLAILPAALPAEPLTLTLDPASTEVTFLLGATGHDVHGILHLSSGQIGFDSEAGTAWGEIALDARRAESGNAKRDKAMHRKVLESETHPLISFRAERLDGAVAPEGESSFRIVGTVTLLGVEHPLELPVVARVEGGQVDATATFPVPYVEWGLHNPSMMVLRVAKSVDVSVHVRGSLVAAEGAQATAANR
jgi:polyisoprenoid-binding protein YceI